MEKKNKKRSKRKIAAIVCLILVVLVAGAAGSAYSVFKMKFYDKSNYVRRGTYVAAANTEKKTKEGEKQDVEVRTSTEVSHFPSTAAQKIHNASAVAVSSAPETEEGNGSNTLTSSSFRSSLYRKQQRKRKQYAGEKWRSSFSPKKIRITFYFLA